MRLCQYEYTVINPYSLEHQVEISTQAREDKLQKQPVHSLTIYRYGHYLKRYIVED